MTEEEKVPEELETNDEGEDEGADVNPDDGGFEPDEEEKEEKA